MDELFLLKNAVDGSFLIVRLSDSLGLPYTTFTVTISLNLLRC
jgi:hypothetical protein